ncbi:MAG: hypothetical protein F6K14_11985 [Symploca sp. SIO2C1]|nr:hypothetical protein [Symploca sp. SIO2C1]
MGQIQMDQSIQANKEKVFALLLMRFNIQPSKANVLAEKWLNQHPEETWESLKILLKNEQVTVSRGLLKELPQSSTPKSPTIKYRDTSRKNSHQLKSTPSVNKNRYRGVEY